MKITLKKDYQMIKVKHPEYGDVIFSRPTLRQLDVLKHYKKLCKKVLSGKEKSGKKKTSK